MNAFSRQLISTGCLIALGLLVSARPLRAQPATPTSDARPAIEAAIASRPIESVEDKRQFVIAVVELSRLLPNPDDQIRLITETANRRQDDKNLAYDVAAEAQRRLRRWREIDASLISPDAETALAKLMDVIKPIIELFEPADLIKRFQGLLEDPGKVEALSAVEKSALYSRGIPPAKLSLPAAASDTAPRELADLLAGRVIGLPALPTLLSKASGTLSLPGVQAGFGEETSDVAMEMMAVLLGRSLGLDGEDLRPGGDLSKSEYWQVRAESLGAKHLWRWETVARVLQAAHSIDAGARTQAAEAAMRTWANVEQVYLAFSPSNASSADAWPAMRDWITRLSDGSSGSLEARDQMPLSADFRSRGRLARNRLEGDFLQARNGGDDDEAFRLMQRAKSAELTLTGTAAADAVLDVDSLKRIIGFRGDPRPREIHLYIELIQLTTGAIHAMVVRAPVATIGAGTEFEPTLWLTADSDSASLSTLLSQAIGPLADSANLNIIVALDGRLRGGIWLGAESTLLDRVSGPQGWIAFVPTAAVFARNSPWTLGAEIRAWYQSLDSAARQTGLSYVTTACEVRNFGLTQVNDNLRHGLVKIISKAATRATSELPCGEGWTVKSKQIANERNGGVLNIPMIVAAERKR